MQREPTEHNFAAFYKASSVLNDPVLRQLHINACTAAVVELKLPSCFPVQSHSSYAQKLPLMHQTYIYIKHDASQSVIEAAIERATQEAAASSCSFSTWQSSRAAMELTWTQIQSTSKPQLNKAWNGNTCGANRHKSFYRQQFTARGVRSLSSKDSKGSSGKISRIL